MNKIIRLILTCTILMQNAQAEIILGDPNFNVDMPVLSSAILKGHQEIDSRGVTEVRSYKNSDTIYLTTGPGSGYSSLDIQGGYASGSARWEAVQKRPWSPNGALTDIDMGGSFTIGDIYITYDGAEAETPRHVRGSVHTSLSLESFGKTRFELAVSMPGYYQNKHIADVEDGVELVDEVISYDDILMAVNSPLYLEVRPYAYIRSIDTDGDPLDTHYLSELNWNLILGGSPAFVLPDGFYANSLDGTIVDNYFVGNVASLPATAVPAPATWLLFAITLVVVIVRHNHFCKIR